jgi:hypothetical protein
MPVDKPTIKHVRTHDYKEYYTQAAIGMKAFMVQIKTFQSPNTQASLVVRMSVLRSE